MHGGGPLQRPITCFLRDSPVTPGVTQIRIPANFKRLRRLRAVLAGSAGEGIRSQAYNAGEEEQCRSRRELPFKVVSVI